METRIKMLGLVLLVTLPWAVGCASGARMVRADARGGELETWGPVVPATQHMRGLLVEHCQGRFTVAERQAARGDKPTAKRNRFAFSCDRARPVSTDADDPQYPVATSTRRDESVAVVTPETRSEP